MALANGSLIVRREVLHLWIGAAIYPRTVPEVFYLVPEVFYYASVFLFFLLLFVKIVLRMRKQKLTINEYELPVVVREQPEGGYVATCLLWSDCYAQADTMSEVLNEIFSVASSLIELYKEEDLDIPLKLVKTSQKQSTDLNFTFPVIVSA